MNQKVKIEQIFVEGMSCSNCERAIESKLKELDGVLAAKASFSESAVKLTYDISKVDIETITSTIEKLDFKVTGQRDFADASVENKMLISGTQFVGIGIIAFALYWIIKNTVGFDFIPEINQSMGYGVLFTVGLLTSFHCLAMCGGINLSQCVSYNSNKEERKIWTLSQLKPSILYNFGRVISYTVIGGIVGSIGSLVSFSGMAKGIVALVAGVFMVIMGLNMLNVFPWLRKINPRMPKIFRKSVDEGKAGRGPLYIGLLNGLMPCGPLQAVQIYALGTGSFAKGAVSMLLFSLGTVPLMFGLGTLGAFLGGKFTHKMMKVSAVLVMLLGVVMAGRGLALSGIGMPSIGTPNIDVPGTDMRNIAISSIDAPKTSMSSITESITGVPDISSQTKNVNKTEKNVQLVSTRLTDGEYSPIVVQKGIPVKWTIIAQKGDLNGCNNPLTIPKFNITKKLVIGENVIEFTPTEEGNIVYTCWMGMKSSNIKVVSDTGNK